MKKLLMAIIAISLLMELHAQTVIQMTKSNGVYLMPCKVNGLTLKFIFDTGASDVSISITEALFMLKNGYLSKNEFIGTEYYQIANGEIAEGSKIILKTVEIGKLKLYNVRASIVHNLSAPLLLGQSALSKLGKIEFDYAQSTLTIHGGPTDYVYDKSGTDNSYTDKTSESSYNGYYKFQTTFNTPLPEVPLRKEPNPNSYTVYKCPKDAVIYIIDISGDLYFKAYVNGYTGYISKNTLKRQW